MRKLFCLLMLFLAPFFMFAQEEDEDLAFEKFQKEFEAFKEQYKSSEQDAYYHRDFKYVPFEPISEERIKNYKNRFFEFEPIDDFTPYEKDKEFHTPYEDSLRAVEKERIELYRDSTSVPSGLFWHEPQEYGGVPRECILKQDKKGQTEAFVYWNPELENNGLGIYVAYSIDGGKTWDRYYTGIVQKKPLYVKWYSNYPLINTDGDLQIEACLLRRCSEYGWHGFHDYELIQDGLLLTIDMETLKRDTDDDGLTDIVETKFRTNPNNPDTDGDGIPDKVDLNPRYNLPRTDRTAIYEAVLNEHVTCFWGEDECENISYTETPEPGLAVDTTFTKLIVTDDPDLLSCQPSNTRIVFLTEEEYHNTKSEFEDDLEQYDFSPLFKVDNVKDAYLFDFSTYGGGFWEADYVAEKKSDGWWIRVTSTIIE